MKKEESKFNMLDWWKKVVLENYANFKGRANRSEYWYFVLFNVLLIFVPAFALGFLSDLVGAESFSIAAAAMYLIIFLGTFIPGLAVAVRRLHDLDKSGSWLFFYFVPFIGGIMLLVWLCSEGTIGNNKYGRDPNAPEDIVFDFEQQPLEQQ